MSWSIGGPDSAGRFVGYGVPAYCDYPDCNEEIDRGLAHVCGDEQPFGGDDGCGLYFCAKHHDWRGYCERCAPYVPDDEDGDDDGTPDVPRNWSPFDAKPEYPTWMLHILTDDSWQEWRDENPTEVEAFRAALRNRGAA